MKFLMACAVIVLSINASAQKVIQGSDTLAGVMSNAIQAAGFSNKLVYQGGGSSKGEKALLNGEQGIAPMSRAAKDSALTEAASKGLELIGHQIALDGVGVFAHNSNPAQGLDLDTLAKIFACEITSWDQVPAANRSGAIKVFRRDDFSGTTDTFKSLVMKKAGKSFGACAQVLAETVDIAEVTSSDRDAIAYSGATAQRNGNRMLPIAQSGTDFVELNAFTVRAGNYPLARALYIYEVGGAQNPTSDEADFLYDYILDRSFMDPIVQDNDFYTLD